MRSLGFSQRTEKQSQNIPNYLPDFIAEGILDVDFERLKKVGVTHLLLDLDQTIRQRNAQEVKEEIIQYLFAARTDIGFKEIYLVTNNRRNIQNFGDTVQAKIFQPYKFKRKTVRKPSRKFFENILNVANIKPRQAVMIGDKLRFDISGAKRVGMYTVYVSPLGEDYWYDRFLFTRSRDRRKLLSAKKSAGLFSLISTESQIKEALQHIGFNVKKVQAYVVDARGSQPFIASDGKRKVFIKLISGKTNLFDWIFKLSRRVVRRRLEDEVPYVSPKQAVEHEAYISKLAFEAGVRTPQIIGFLDLKDHRFAHVTEFIEGKTLSSIKPKQLSDKVLIDLWQQVDLLHKAQIAHRDLRADNILLDDKNRSWLVDFHFSTSAATAKNLQKDNVELLVSLATIVGIKRSIKFASTTLRPKDFQMILALLKYRTLSAATRSEVRKHRGLLKKLRDYVEVLSVASQH